MGSQHVMKETASSYFKGDVLKAPTICPECAHYQVAIAEARRRCSKAERMREFQGERLVNLSREVELAQEVLTVVRKYGTSSRSFPALRVLQTYDSLRSASRHRSDGQRRLQAQLEIQAQCLASRHHALAEMSEANHAGAHCPALNLIREDEASISQIEDSKIRVGLEHMVAEHRHLTFRVCQAQERCKQAILAAQEKMMVVEALRKNLRRLKGTVKDLQTHGKD